MRVLNDFEVKNISTSRHVFVCLFYGFVFLLLMLLSTAAPTTTLPAVMVVTTTSHQLNDYS